MRTALLAALVLTAVACSTEPTHDRGWVGGTFHPLPSETEQRALLVDVAEGTPLWRAGFREGDVVFAVNDEPVDGPLDLRRKIEDLEPGEGALLNVRGAGRAADRRILVGTESYQNRITIGLGLFFQPELDLWPFDDGFNILGLIAVDCRSERHETLAAEALYAKRAGAPNPELPAHQEGTRFRVLPLLFAVDKEIVGRR
jgi:membrane-associated protease RseP (regulator of RpoE activity)